MFLLLAWQLARAFEDLAQLARRSRAAFWRFFCPEQMFNGNAAQLCEGLELFWSQRDRMTLPGGVTCLMHSELVGDLRLRKPSSLACSVEAVAEICARLF